MNFIYQGNAVDQSLLFNKIGYKPHKAQQTIHNSSARFRYLACGRRFGKTLLAAHEITTASCVPFQRFWVVAPTYSLTEKAFREIYKNFLMYMPNWIEKASESELKIKLKNQTIIECKSADNPESLLGEGLNGMIIDEAARIKDDVWQQYLRPTLSDKQGWMMAISTPQGMNWFYRGFQDGVQKINNTESWNFTTADNPYIVPEEIALAKATLPERVFEQEYMGRFLGNVGGVFRNIRECISGVLEDYKSPRRYVIGVDLAKYQDFTVIIVVCLNTMQVVYFDRFNQIDWSLQEKRIINVWQRYGNAMIVVDATGVGDRVYEELAKTIPNVIGYQIKGSNKNDLIDNLAMMIENKQIFYPEIPELLNELNIYEYEVTRAGNTKLSAPIGYHDDCVIALALAAHALDFSQHQINTTII
jgi:hypothetical protein